MREDEKIKIERGFYLAELVDYETYSLLARKERHHKLKVLLERLAAMEEKHLGLWRHALEEHGYIAKRPSLVVQLKILGFLMARRLLGVAFVVRLLGRNELRSLDNYTEAIKNRNIGLTRIERRYLDIIIRDENYHEERLKRSIREYAGELNYIRSMVLGLNDGLVELLAAISGLAVIATSSIIVVAGGLIVGISGTLSMAGGVYLSSKSHELVDSVEAGGKRSTTPMREALYTGIFYFLGSVIAVLPFFSGLLGYEGIAASIILVSLTLMIASTIIAVVSGTSISKRCLEMLAISLGATFITIILGNILKVHFGITV